MGLPVLFCPQCNALIYDADQCSNCSWHRPTTSGTVGSPAWAVALESALPSKLSHPVSNGNYVFFPTDSGEIVALNAFEAEPEQAIKWRFRIDSRYRCHSVAVWDEHLVIGSEFSGGFPTPSGELILVDAVSGAEVWRYQIKGASLSVPVIHENIAYFTVSSGRLYAVDLKTRKELWQQEIPSPWSWAPYAPTRSPTGLLILPSRSDHLVAFDIQKRNLTWTFNGGGWFTHSPVWVDGSLYARCWDQHIYALEETNGRKIWQHRAPRDYSSDLRLSDTYLYVGAKDFADGAEQGANAYALYTLDRHTGKRVGRYEVAGRIFGRPLATDSAVFFATDDSSRMIESQGTLYALDARGETPLWDPCVVEQRFQADLLFVGEWIIAGTRQGAIYAVPWQTQEAIDEAPQAYEARGEWEKAAIAYALNHEDAKAAKIYAEQLNRPLQAGQLYLQLGRYQRVVELLGQSDVQEERALAFKAIEALPEGEERAIALCHMNEYLGAANVYHQLGEFEKAGDCYLEIRAWDEAKQAYHSAQAWDKWEKVTRELELWQDLVERFVAVGKFAQAAEVQAARGYFAEAAALYEQAQMPTEAFDAYRKIDAANLTELAQQRLLSLAEELGELEVAYETYKALGQRERAAQMAAASGQYNQALELYRELGEYSQAAEMLEKLNRYREAADMYEQARSWGQAAKNLERQVDHEIERLGGIRYVQDTQELETWLNRAIEFYEEEANYAADEETRNEHFDGADRCRVSLMRVRREPLLKLQVKADELVYNQGNTIHFIVENVGWGTARNITLSVSSTNLQNDEVCELGSLGRRQKAEGVATIVPTLVGEIMLQIELQGESKSGEILEVVSQPLAVAPVSAIGGQGVLLNTQVGRGTERMRSAELPVADRGTLWEVGTATSTGARSEVPVSPEQLRQQETISSSSRLRRRASVEPIAIGASVISSVVVPLDLEADAQDFVKNELKWLFSALENLLNIQRQEIERTVPIPVPIPEDARRHEQATNQLLNSIDHFEILSLQKQIEDALEQIKTRLGNLSILRSEEARKGAAAKGDVALQNDIRSEQIDIIETIRRLAILMEQAYGIFVVSPDELAQYLE